MQLGAFFGKKPATAAAGSVQAARTPPAAGLPPAYGDAELRDKAASLRAQRAAISRASGRLNESEPLLLHNLAAALANTQRQLD